RAAQRRPGGPPGPTAGADRPAVPHPPTAGRHHRRGARPATALPGAPPGGAAGWCVASAAGEIGQPAPVTGEVERVLGRPARTYAEWVADHAAAFRSEQEQSRTVGSNR